MKEMKMFVWKHLTKLLPVNALGLEGKQEGRCVCECVTDEDENDDSKRFLFSSVQVRVAVLFLRQKGGKCLFVWVFLLHRKQL